MRIWYRARQFWGGLRAHVTAEELRQAEAVLNPPAREWFQALPRDLQWHGLQVMRALQQAGIDRPEVLAAALLHDAGKAVGPSGPIVRALSVLAIRLMPEWSSHRKRLDYRTARGFDRVLVIAYQHPAIAAQRALACGCDPVTIALIRDHQDPERAVTDPVLRLFQQVDDQN